MVKPISVVVALMLLTTTCMLAQGNKNQQDSVKRALTESFRKSNGIIFSKEGVEPTNFIVNQTKVGDVVLTKEGKVFVVAKLTFQGEILGKKNKKATWKATLSYTLGEQGAFLDLTPNGVEGGETYSIQFERFNTFFSRSGTRGQIKNESLSRYARGGEVVFTFNE